MWKIIGHYLLRVWGGINSDSFKMFFWSLLLSLFGLKLIDLDFPYWAILIFSIPIYVFGEICFTWGEKSVDKTNKFKCK